MKPILVHKTRCQRFFKTVCEFVNYLSQSQCFANFLLIWFKHSYLQYSVDNFIGEHNLTIFTAYTMVFAQTVGRKSSLSSANCVLSRLFSLRLDVYPNGTDYFETRRKALNERACLRFILKQLVELARSNKSLKITETNIIFPMKWLHVWP